MHIHTVYSIQRHKSPSFGRLAPTGQLRQQTTRFWNALEVYSSMGRVPESEVYRGAKPEVYKIAIFPYKVVIVAAFLITVNMAKMD